MSSAAANSPSSAGAGAGAGTGEETEQRPGKSPTAAGVDRAGTQQDDDENDPEKLKAKAKAKERQLRSKLQEKFTSVTKESQRLRAVQGELEALQREHARDVDVLMKRIEETERNLTYADRELKAREEAYENAKAAATKLREEKELLAQHLLMIVTENEKKKLAKLDSLMHSIGVEDEEEAASRAAKAAEKQAFGGF